VRPFRVPGPNGVFSALCIITTAFVALGSWVSIFPGTLETLIGIDYDFSQASGVSYASFEALTLGTLAFIVLLALVGYIRGRKVREYVG
jgi:hypothetical protein